MIFIIFLSQVTCFIKFFKVFLNFTFHFILLWERQLGMKVLRAWFKLISNGSEWSSILSELSPISNPILIRIGDMLTFPALFPGRTTIQTTHDAITYLVSWSAISFGRWALMTACITQSLWTERSLPPSLWSLSLWRWLFLWLNFSQAHSSCALALSFVLSCVLFFVCLFNWKLAYLLG